MELSSPEVAEGDYAGKVNKIFVTDWGMGKYVPPHQRAKRGAQAKPASSTGALLQGTSWENLLERGQQLRRVAAKSRAPRKRALSAFLRTSGLNFAGIMLYLTFVK